MCELCWVVFPRLLQDLSLSGENSYFFLVERAGVTGEKLVKSSDQPSRRVFATPWCWDWDVRLNQIPEDWHQVAVKFRKTNGIRDGDQTHKLW
ncbi:MULTISPECIES: hypothetical protein [unclassified Prochlorococcus]|uniref:hypothetical protein n=1 Tax=unclassified Prochlorococcus TaxID=2627481 RepID=UPI000533998D|nr:hypothetical protein [Prochlorococcus sp. MIT 0703]KGG23271.1 hypothetical protein EV12_3122 [Prochlorococcus sp. MIT 0701]KGG25266.1 hypothetical protein EV13_3091 [Prochlorococcus sp. MIT 0702]KGG30297.1 hypothetical protein EV14_3033 [Prochlorococcus sp. MIT 0703]